MSKSKMMVVGYGKIGRRYAQVFSEAFDVHVYSSREVGDDVKELGCKPVVDFDCCAASSDYIFLAVPVYALEGLVERLNRCVRTDCRVIDMCSARLSAKTRLKKLKCRWFGIHAGGCSGDPDLHILEFLAKKDHNYRRMSAEEHDRRTSLIAMAHFVGLPLEDMMSDEDREGFATSPAARNLLRLVDHLKNNAPATYWESQVCNPFTGRHRRRLIESMANYSAKLDRGEFPFAPELSGRTW